MFKKSISLLTAVVILLGMFTGCVSDGANTSTSKVQTTAQAVRLNIVCTLFPQYDFVRQIVGDKADVTMLLSPGMESHTYEPTPADMINVTSSDLFIYIGDNMETWASPIIDIIESDSTDILNVSQALGLKLEAHVHDKNEKTEDGDNGVDPHIWTSPMFAAEMVDVICDVICKLDANNSDFYKENADSYRTQILNLHAEFKDIVSKAKIKKIYFADEFALTDFVNLYGLDHLAAFDTCGENSEASASKIAKIISEIESNNIPVIFYSELSVSKEAKQISAETGAQMLLFHSCHNVTADEFSAGETYVSLMTKNAKNLKTALGVTE